MFWYNSTRTFTLFVIKSDQKNKLQHSNCLLPLKKVLRIPDIHILSCSWSEVILRIFCCCLVVSHSMRLTEVFVQKKKKSSGKVETKLYLFIVLFTAVKHVKCWPHKTCFCFIPNRLVQVSYLVS